MGAPVGKGDSLSGVPASLPGHLTIPDCREWAKDWLVRPSSGWSCPHPSHGISDHEDLGQDGRASWVQEWCLVNRAEPCSHHMSTLGARPWFWWVFDHLEALSALGWGTWTTRQCPEGPLGFLISTKCQKIWSNAPETNFCYFLYNIVIDSLCYFCSRYEYIHYKGDHQTITNPLQPTASGTWAMRNISRDHE